MHHKEASTFCSQINNYEPNKSCTCNEPWLTCKICQFVSLQGKINFRFVPFQSIIATKLSSVHINYFVSLKKRCLVHDTNVHKTFSALNLTIFFIKSITCIITQPLSFFSEILFFHLTFFFKHTMMDHRLADTYIQQSFMHS